METETKSNVAVMPPREVRAASAETLCQAVITLTHRIHECRGSVVAGECDGPCDNLRLQREVAVRELCRRANR